MSLYKPGDRVVVRGDLTAGRYYGMEGEIPPRCSVVAEMTCYAGTAVTIRDVRRLHIGETRYRIEEDDGWSWTDGMFTGLEDDSILVFGMDDLFEWGL